MSLLFPKKYLSELAGHKSFGGFTLTQEVHSQGEDQSSD
jgi:hypothetical protein